MIRRRLKNTVKNYTQAEILVREATSNDPWGASSSLMHEIAELTNNVMAFHEIMQIIWKRLNDRQKNWRHVYKSLVLLDYLLKAGSPRVAEQCRQNIHCIRTLRDFQYFEEHKDYGMNVREKSKAVLTLLQDEELLQSERERCLAAKARLANTPTAMGSSQAVRYGMGGTGRALQSNSRVPPSRSGNPYRTTTNLRMSDSTPDLSRIGNSSQNASRGARPDADEIEEELQLRLALALSKEEHEKHQRKLREEQERETSKMKIALEASLKEDPTRERANSVGDLLGMDPWALPAPPSANTNLSNGLLDNSFSSGNGRRGPLPSVPKTDSSLDPWGGVPADGGVNTRGREFDAWASGGRTYLGFADGFGGSGKGADISSTASAPKSYAVPARCDDSYLLSLDTNPSAPKVSNDLDDIFGPISSKPSQNDSIASSGFRHDPFELNSNAFSTPHNFKTKPSSMVGSRMVASKSAHDLSTSIFDDNDDDFLGSSIQDKPKTTGNTEKSSNAIKDFLGANASLVDLDNIVTKPKGPPANKSPFQYGGGIGASTSVFSSSVSANPFTALQAAQPKPSLNAIAQQNNSNSSTTFSTFSSDMGSMNSSFPLSNDISAPPPMFPLSSGGNFHVLSQPTSAWQPINNSHMNAQSTVPAMSLNPFL